MVDVKLPKWACGSISRNDFLKVSKAIADAEKKTSAELVSMIVHQSTSLQLVRFIQALLLSIMSYIFLSLFLFDLPASWRFALEAAATSLIFFGCYTFCPVPGWFLRLVVSDEDQDFLVNARAELEFYRSSIHTTAGATGVLIFVSLAEHRVVVLADKAVSDKLPPTTWDEVVSIIISGIKSQTLANGLAQAVDRCGQLLAETFPINSHDHNELPNDLIIKD
jgi:putative membrane protein